MRSKAKDSKKKKQRRMNTNLILNCLSTWQQNDLFGSYSLSLSFRFFFIEVVLLQPSIVVVLCSPTAPLKLEFEIFKAPNLLTRLWCKEPLLPLVKVFANCKWLGAWTRLIKPAWTLFLIKWQFNSTCLKEGTQVS